MRKGAYTPLELVYGVESYRERELSGLRQVDTHYILAADGGRPKTNTFYYFALI